MLIPEASFVSTSMSCNLKFERLSPERAIRLFGAVIIIGIYLAIRCVMLIYLSINLKNISKIKEGE